MRIVIPLPVGIKLANQVGDIIPMLDDDEPPNAPVRWGSIVAWNETHMTIEIFSEVTCNSINLLEELWKLT